MNLQESIRRILREETEEFVLGVWGNNGNNYSINKLIKLVKERKPKSLHIDTIIDKNYKLKTKEGNFIDNLNNPTKSFKKRVMKVNTQFPIMINDDGLIIDGSHRIAKQKWLGIKKIRVHIISKNDLKKTIITDPEEIEKSRYK